MTDAELSPMAWSPETLGSDEPSPLSHVAQLTEQARNHPALFGLQASVHPIRAVGICGAGVMGTGIAIANIRRGIRVKLYDASPERTAESPQRASRRVFQTDSLLAIPTNWSRYARRRTCWPIATC